MIPIYRRRYVEILEFTHFVTFFSFNKIGENHKEKILVKKVRISDKAAGHEKLCRLFLGVPFIRFVNCNSSSVCKRQCGIS